MTLQRIHLTILICTLASLAACAQSPELKQPALDSDSQELPALAELDGLRTPANLNRAVTLGKNTYVKSGNAMELPGGELKMEDPDGKPCWAIWQIPNEPEYLDSIFFDILSPEGEGCYLGLADFSIGRWQFSGPYTEQTTLQFEPDWQVSPAGYHYVAVLTEGASSVELAQLHAYFQDGWQQITLSVGVLPIQDISLASIDNRPAVLWQLGTGLHYAFSSTDDGLSLADWTRIDISVGPGGASGVDLQEINGRPAFSFSYSDVENSNVLGYAWSSTSTGALPSHWDYRLLDQRATIGYHNSLALIDGKPAISYAYLNTTHELWYTRSSDLHGGDTATWTAPVRIDYNGTEDIGVDCSLAEIDGKPAVAYHAEDRLRYAWSSTPTGESEEDWNIRNIDVESDNRIGLYASLAQIGGKPAIAYYDQLHADLKYAWSDKAQGQSAGDWTVMEVSGPPIAGQYASLLELDGHPAVSYYTVGLLRDLVFDEAVATQDGMSWDWGPLVIVDDREDIDPPDVGKYCDMTLVNGRPVIAYYDETNTALKFAVRVLP